VTSVLQVPEPPTAAEARVAASRTERANRRGLLWLLTPPTAWLVVLYIGSLFFLLITAFWFINPFTSKVVPGFTLENFISIVTVPAYLATSIRSLFIALAVTIIAILLAVPIGIYMAKIASPAVRALLAVTITLPLWAGYLVKVIAMRVVFTENGFLNWLLAPFGLSGPGFNTATVIITLTYLWFPFMALPVYTAVRQIPNSYFDASADLGAKSWRTIRTVVLPLIKPAIIAGSVFTFSLSLGDYLVARFVGGSTQMIGSIIASNINLNPPVAAAFSTVPIAFVLVYLWVVRKMGALERL
jgi:putative spermidine/putrescine transport system permease protein